MRGKLLLLNLLFVLGSVYPLDDANSNIVNSIAANLKSRDEEIRVIELGLNDQLNPISKYEINGVTIYGMGDTFKTRLSKKLVSYLDSFEIRTKVHLIVSLLKRPGLAIEFLVKKIRYGNVQRCYQVQIKEICAKERIDIIICVSYPFLTAMAVAKLKMKLPFIYYQLDPFFSHYMQPNRRKALSQEAYVCERSDAIIMTDLIYNDYIKSSLSKYLTKSIILGFPAIEENSRCNAMLGLREEGIIRLAFVGTLYEDIRSPSYLFILMNELVNRGIQIHLDLVGPLVGNISIPQTEWLSYHGRLSVSEAKTYIQQADILINIGNLITNQMPSKLFEYFSTGKPIINLYKTDDCPTLPYANKYPYCINVKEALDVDIATCESIEAFILKNKGKLMPLDKVVDMFPECTTGQVANKFMQVVQRVINDNN